LELTGVLLAIPEIADYEVRRELLRAGIVTGIRRLDDLKGKLGYVPITTGAVLRAAELWAGVRRAGIPTASPDALDADCLVAGQAITLGGPGDSVTIATTNVVHLSRFPGVDARIWSTIT
jgi:predicted nucleic acid-binding protein